MEFHLGPINLTKYSKVSNYLFNSQIHVQMLCVIQ